MKIAFLHTMEGNVALFGNAAIKAGWSPDDIQHATREDLRQAMSQPGALDGSAHDVVQRALRGLIDAADAVIVTCATLGPAVDSFESPPVPIIRVDAALAKAAAKSGKNRALMRWHSRIRGWRVRWNGWAESIAPWMGSVQRSRRSLPPSPLMRYRSDGSSLIPHHCAINSAMVLVMRRTDSRCTRSSNPCMSSDLGP